MKLRAFAFVTLMLTSVASAQSYSHNYSAFFGKDDRTDLYSQDANERFPATILQTIINNTLLMNCGSQGKPSTAFVLKTKSGSKVVSAAHNLTMAHLNALDCKLGKVVLPKGLASKDFKDSGTKEDAGFDIALWPNTTAQEGFKICKTLEISSQYILVQSLDGTGRLGVSPSCKVTSVEGKLITTTCRGHYKASGGPLLKITDNTVCAAGVFNAHSGKPFNYESYAARLMP